MLAKILGPSKRLLSEEQRDEHAFVAEVEAFASKDWAVGVPIAALGDLVDNDFEVGAATRQ